MDVGVQCVRADRLAGRAPRMRRERGAQRQHGDPGDAANRVASVTHVVPHDRQGPRGEAGRGGDTE